MPKGYWPSLRRATGLVSILLCASQTAMTSHSLITPQELADFAAAIRRHGWRTQDFELQEDVFDPGKAEVEAAAGEVGVRCLTTEGVQVYRLGAGFAWVPDFAADLEHGKFGSPSRS